MKLKSLALRAIKWDNADGYFVIEGYWDERHWIEADKGDDDWIMFSILQAPFEWWQWRIMDPRWTRAMGFKRFHDAARELKAHVNVCLSVGYRPVTGGIFGTTLHEIVFEPPFDDGE